MEPAKSGAAEDHDRNGPTFRSSLALKFCSGSHAGNQPATNLSSDHSNRGQRGLRQCRQLFRMPPATADDNAFGCDLAVTDQVLTDDVNVVELALLDRDEGGIADASGFEAPEFGTPQR